MPIDFGDRLQEMYSAQARQQMETQMFGLSAAALGIGASYQSQAGIGSYRQTFTGHPLSGGSIAVYDGPKTLREELQTETNEWLK